MGFVTESSPEARGSGGTHRGMRRLSGAWSDARYACRLLQLGGVGLALAIGAAAAGCSSYRAADTGEDDSGVNTASAGGKSGKSGTGGKGDRNEDAGTVDASEVDRSAGGSSGGAPPGSGGAHTMGSGGASSSGGAGTGGAGTGGAPSLCGNGKIEPNLGEECDDGNTRDQDDCTSTCRSNCACKACLANNCNGPVVAATCSSQATQAARDACYTVVACAERTQCHMHTPGSGAVDSFCGDAKATDCQVGQGLNGACKDTVWAAALAAPGTLFDPADPSNQLDWQKIFVGAGQVGLSPATDALAYVGCEYNACGPPDNFGNYECSKDKGPGAGGAGTSTGCGAGGGG